MQLKIKDSTIRLNELYCPLKCSHREWKHIGLRGLKWVENVLGGNAGGQEKACYVQEWGAENTVVVGNGVDDQPMFFIGGLKIAVLGPEGVGSGVLAASSIVVKSPEDAIRLLLNPKRLIATLRK